MGTSCRERPTREKAQTWYAQHKPTLDAVDRAVRKAVSEMPGFQGPFRCELLAPAAEKTQCAFQERAWTERHVRQLSDFQDQVLPTFLDRPSVLGVEVLYFEPNRPERFGLGRGGNSSGMFDPRLQGDDVLKLDGRTVGWGTFQTARQDATGANAVGDSTPRPGILVSWRFRSGNGTEFVVTVDVLAEHETTEQWRAATKAALERAEGAQSD